MFLYGILFSVIGAFSMGAYGYFKGYQICNQAQEIKILRAEIKRLNISYTYMKSAVEASKEILEENEKIINGNNTLINSLTNDIINEQNNSKKLATNCTIDGVWLRATNTIK